MFSDRDYLANFERCEIFAKGPSFENTPVQAGTLRVCINEAAIHTDTPMMIVCNDVEPLHNIEKALASGEMRAPSHNTPILAPQFPHKNLKTTPNPLSSYPFYTILSSYGYTWIPYNLKTAKTQKPDIITLNTAMSSTVTAVEFLVKHVPKVRHITTRGMARGAGYHQAFEKYADTSRAPSTITMNNFERTCKDLCGKTVSIKME